MKTTVSRKYLANDCRLNPTRALIPRKSQSRGRGASRPAAKEHAVSQKIFVHFFT